MFESSRQTSLQKTSTENSVNVIATTNGTTNSSVNKSNNKKFCKNHDLLFDESKEGMSLVALPTIAMETHQDKSSDDIVIGPKCEQGHPQCFSGDANC